MKKFFFAALTICVFHASTQAADKITIGYADNSATFLPLSLGRRAEFFQKHGMQAQSIRIRSSVALTALVSGELDYHSVIGPAIAAAIRGVPKSSPVTPPPLPL
jgi:ABC-type nitrate/sulfonate/bicarbonate transport system substrate-binding protein